MDALRQQRLLPRQQLGHAGGVRRAAKSNLYVLNEPDALLVAFPVGAVAVSYVAAREVYRSIVNRRRSAIGRLFDLVVEEARTAIGQRSRALPETT